MKLRNKKTGEIANVEGLGYAENEIQMTYTINNDETNLYLYCTPSLITFNEDWTDYEEPKEYWYIDCYGMVIRSLVNDNEWDERRKRIGNYFETEEEAEKALEKLKAWKRLKDSGITFKNWTINQTGTIDCFATWGDNIPPSRKNPTLLEDLDLLFGGEE